METPRRTFLARTSVALIASSLAQPFSTLSAQKKTGKTEEQEEGVSTNEDLMREHGVLNRILLIYEEAMRRMQGKEKVDVDVISKSASLIKRFIEEYHEKLEEDYLFPRSKNPASLWTW